MTGNAAEGTRPESSAARLRFETNLGAIHIEVDLHRAPMSSSAFLTFVDEGRFQQAAFWRTVRSENDASDTPIQVIQARLGVWDGAAPGIPHEPTSLTGIRHVDGVVSLARGDIGTASPVDFFICIDDQPELDFGGRRNPDGQGFAAFGHVIEGMDIVRRVHQGATKADAAIPSFAGQVLVEPIKILSILRDST